MARDPESNQPEHSEIKGFSRPDPRTVSSIYIALMLVVLSVGAIWVMVQAKSILVLFFVALLIACSLDSPVKRLEKWGTPRAAAILLLFSLVGAFAVGAIWYAVPPLIGQLSETVDSLPDRARQFQQLRERIDSLKTDYPMLEDVEDQAISSLSGFVTSLSQWVVGVPALITLAIFVVTSLFTLSFLMLMSWSSIKVSFFRLVHPNHRAVVERVITSSGERLGAYVRAKFIICTVVGVWMYIVMILLGSQIALLIAIVAAMFEIIPRIGPLIARMLIVVAVLPLGWKAVLIAFALHMVIDNIKGSWLSPLIEGHQVEVHPLTAFAAVMIGAVIMGWMGALIAVPTAAVVQVIFEEVIVPWRLRQLNLADSVPDLERRDPMEDPGEPS
ncbi:MAG: AI-2E family transporter [Thermomicrobiales bacterium]|nr:AI-2E family transporter [Thermomicrobiales bacterium]